MSQTILIGQIEHETNTFSSVPTDYDAFADTSLYYGDDVTIELQNTNTAIGGFLRVAEEEGWDVVPTVAGDATPGGIVTADALSTLLDELIAGIEDSDPDGILIALHGAMVSSDYLDADGYILKRIRESAGDVPIMATLDLHANVSDRMIEHADGLFGYDTYPHVDIHDTGETAASVLAATLKGKLDPCVVVKRAPLLLPLPPLQTSEDPMQSLIEQAAANESPARPDVSVFGGFAYADVPEAGFSVVSVADSSIVGETEQVCQDIANDAYNNRKAFHREYTSVETAISTADRWDSDANGGPLLLADIADNPGGGSAEDGTVILEKLLEKGIEDTALALIADPVGVEAGIEAGVGEMVSVNLGGRVEDNGNPLPVKGVVRFISDGNYTNQGPMSKGLDINLGRTVVLDVNGIEVIISSHRQQPYDPEVFRSQGIVPERKNVLIVKSTVHYRAAFEPLVGDILEVAAPGLCDPDLSAFNYKRVRRPIYPLDLDA